VDGTIRLVLPPGICDYKRPDAVFAGVTVRLLDGAGGVVATTTTDAEGNYHFGDLAPGSYAVQVVAPGGTRITDGALDGNGISTPIFLGSGAALDVDAGLNHLTGTMLDGTPFVPANANAIDVNSPSFIQWTGAGQANTNAPGSYLIGGTGGLTIGGNAADQYIIGGKGDNFLHGGPNGAVTGGSVLVGGSGANIFEGTSGNDIIIGGCGVNTPQGLGSTTEGLAGFDIIIGGPSGDVLEGNNSIAMLVGSAGNDQVNGDGTLIGGANDGTIRWNGAEFTGVAVGDKVNGYGRADLFVYQAGDGVQWIENYKPEEGDRLEIYGYQAPARVGSWDGFTIWYFGENAALLFNNKGPTDNVTFYGLQDSMGGGFGHAAPLPPVLLANPITSYYGTQGDDMVVASELASTLQGNGGDDVLIGGAGNDSFDGGAGNDSFYGMGGRDSFAGGAGNDAYYVDGQTETTLELAGGGLDTIISTDSVFLVANIENLTLVAGKGDLTGIGNALANVLVGNDGANALFGYEGNDTISGGAGNDFILGVTGDDVLNGDDGVDYLTGGIGNDTINGGSKGDAIYGEDGNDSLTGGPDFATDFIVAGDGNDTLNGASGNGDFDFLYGGLGDDLFYVDTPFDLVFEFDGTAGGIDTVIATIDGGGYYLYANIENMFVGGTTPFGVGNALNNGLIGGAGTQWLLGGAGNDTLNGGADFDVLFGEGGADSFVFERGTGGDVIGDFEVGVDKIRLIGLGFNSLADLQPRMVENGGTTAIDLGLGDFIVLNGVANASLTPNDFVFA
jgi:Ca2+-binding RTX toxin-like protein